MLDSISKNLNIILVPQGAEYRAICSGLGQIKDKKVSILSIPVGMSALSLFLKKWQQMPEFFQNPPTGILLMGLCGSLSPQLQVGDIVIYQSCRLENHTIAEEKCNSDLTNLLCDRLQKKVSLVKGLTCDRVIWSAQEKFSLGQTYQADVVDMESYTAIEMLNRTGIATAILRVISDDGYDIPNLTPAINSNGSLKPLTIATKMAQNPIAATRLIHGSLKGLKVLQQVTKKLFSQSK